MSENELKFLIEIGSLKTLDRKGWIIREDRMIDKPESVAGHMYRMAIMSMMLSNSGGVDGGSGSVVDNQSIDYNIVTQMCLTHDMAECIVGDITPFDGITCEQKHAMESNAMNQLALLLPEKSSKMFLTLFNEYESQETNESKLVKELDRFDVMLQAFQYEFNELKQNNRNILFQDFFDSNKDKIKNPRILQWLQTLNNQRNLFLKNR